MAFSTIQGSGSAPDTFVGGTGVDALALANSEGNFLLGGNAGADVVQFTNTGAALYGGILGTASVKGGAGDDTITLGIAANNTTYSGVFVNGNGDEDTITLRAADTFLAGTIKGGAADDAITSGVLSLSLVNGNKGQDTINVAGNSTGATVRGGAGNDTITSAATLTADSVINGDLGRDTVTLTGGSIDDLTVTGGEGNDTLSLAGAGAGADNNVVVNGNDGDDIITGPGTGALATIFGGSGADTLTSGGSTATTIVGGAGLDSMTGAAGANTFLYTGVASEIGTSVSSGSGGTLAAGDVIGTFTIASDFIALDDNATNGVARAAVAGGNAAWNMNTAGVYVNTATSGTTVTTGTTLNTAVQALLNTGAANSVTGDAGDVGIYVLNNNATLSTVIQVTLGTDAAGRALNATDEIAVVAQITADAGTDLAAANFTFV